MDDQRHLFTTLKPPCVSTSEAALQFRSGKSSGAQLVSRLEDLTAALEDILRIDGDKLRDARLAEYVFFPLSHVFRQRDAVPVRALELALRSLYVLLSTGWRRDIAADLGIQLLILCTSLSNSSDGVLKTSDVTDELLKHDFACLRALVQSIFTSQAGQNALTASKNIPTLGHLITSLLDATVKVDNAEAVLEALAVLHVLTEDLDQQVLAGFLPGIASSLTKLVAPSSATVRHYKVLTKAIDSLSALLEKTLSNRLNFPKAQAGSSKLDHGTLPHLDRNWLNATAGQIKQVLANILKRRRHSRLEVSQALRRLCMVVLQKCNRHLEESVSLTLDALILLSGDEDDDNGAASSLDILLLEHPQYIEHLQQALYSHFLALPRLMVSNDIQNRDTLIGQIKSVLTRLDNAAKEPTIPYELVVSSLFDSLVGSTSYEKSAAEPNVSVYDQAMIEGSSSSIDQFRPGVFNPLAATKADYNSERQIRALIDSLSSTQLSSRTLRSCLDRLHTCTGNEQTTYLWLALQLIKSRTSSVSDVDSLLNFDVLSGDEVAQRNELYSFAVSIVSHLEDYDAETHWRTRALALETVAFQASLLGDDFKAELSEVLYPLLHHIGSSVTGLQSHAMNALNTVAASAGYSSTQELIVDNNDYLINGIGLRLSIFELSPQAPRVLNMLVRLCGAKLLPYLDDLTDNIFEALDLYHGYDNLVGLLFQCLGAIVDEGARGAALTISSPSQKSHRLEAVRPIPPAGLAVLLKTRRRVSPDVEQDETALAGHQEGELPDETPHQPWKRPAPNKEQAMTPDQEPKPSAEENKTPLSKSYQLIHRVAILTQHYLPSENPLIRSHLSHVLITAMPFLAQDEDTFLPLIHTLWPVLVPRLRDSEVGVVVGTLGVIAKMAEGSGAFVKGRIAGIWENIRQVHKRAMRSPDKEVSRHDGPLRSLSQLPASKMSKTSETTGFAAQEVEVKATDQTLFLNESAAEGGDASPGLSVVSTTPRGDHAGFAAQNDSTEGGRSSVFTSDRYVSATSQRIYQALTSFLISIMRHVELPAWMMDEIMSSMLSPYVTRPSRETGWMEDQTRADVLEAMNERNADALWLLKLRHGLLSESVSLSRSRPRDVADAVTFTPVSVLC
ncbi:MAG: hypothetical protein Q9162_000002 [Coniocarpon cinnabarinum]